MNRMDAIELRAAFEAWPGSPEGIELYRWIWVPSDLPNLEVAVSLPPAAVREDTRSRPPTVSSPTIRIMPCLWAEYLSTRQRARAGWDTGCRTAVLFFGRGGPDIPRPPRREAVSDDGMHAIADDGVKLLMAESAERLREMLDELGLEEGEEWKRES